MIRVYKHNIAPLSLSTTSRYDGEDVKAQLIADQYGKCYICERLRDTDFEIEHHQSEKNFPLLRKEWNNLFLACRYCNGKKLQYFDNTLCPKDCDIEDEIKQEIDYANKRAIFTPVNHSSQHNETVQMLERIFNGTRKVRTIKEERFFEKFVGAMNGFHALVRNYLANPTPETAKAVKDELMIDKEYLGFKYWIIKDNTKLNQVFSNDIIWNKRTA